MMLHIPEVLTKEKVQAVRALIDAGQWVDGNVTSGPQSALAKRNAQLAETDPAAREAGDIILASLERALLFVAAALPLKVFPPLFNRYAGGQTFHNHIDNAVRRNRTGELKVRTDLSCTLFLSEPDDYEGGELIVEDTYGAHAVKLPAGDLILYPASSLHRVEPVTRGARVLGAPMARDGAREIARRARGTPRIAGRLLRRVRDFAAVAGAETIDAAVADRALRMLEVDNEGLDALDHRYLNCIAKTYDGGPVGIETMAAALSEPRDALEEIVEPYLLQQGFIGRTPRGRVLTLKAYRHLGLSGPSRQSAPQLALFDADSAGEAEPASGETARLRSPATRRRSLRIRPVTISTTMPASRAAASSFGRSTASSTRARSACAARGRSKPNS